MSRLPIIAVDLTAAGEHPAAWRQNDHQLAPESSADLADLAGLVDGTTHLVAAQLAEAAGVDLVTFGETLEAPAEAPGRVTTQLDALGLAARIAPATSRIGLVPTITTTHTEPFHLQAAIATLDWVSQGRGGWLVDVSRSREAAVAVGRRGVVPAPQLWREATDVVEVSRKLWDSWEDDAIIRDVETGRFVDRDKLHDVDHRGPTFSISGPSIVPRPPQGNPVVVVKVTGQESLGTAAYADVVLLPVQGADDLADRLQQVKRAVAEAGRDPGSVRLLASASFLLGADDEVASGRVHELAALFGGPHPIDVIGAAPTLRQRIESWLALGADGVHLRPAVLGIDLPALLADVVPTLRPQAYVHDGGGPRTTLRHRLGLERPLSQYAAIAS
jgi:alkanesulfonate monooxygenase SsuD/methylene tetrahydromethanopterin reductase-like flavin-dependent oxidoreductase (luciferase family)